MVPSFWARVLGFEILFFSSYLYLQIYLCLFKLSFTQRLFLSVTKCHDILIHLCFVGNIIFIGIEFLISIFFSTISWNWVFNFLSSILWIKDLILDLLRTHFFAWIGRYVYFLWSLSWIQIWFSLFFIDWLLTLVAWSSII